MQNVIPAYNADLFDDAALAEPYGHYAAIRALGAAVRLPKHDLWAISRFDDVREALRNRDVLISGRGVAANDPANEMGRGTLLNSDPPTHTRLRKVMSAPLLPGSLTEIKDRVTAMAETLVNDLATRGSFDAATDLAQALPVGIVSHFVGLPEAGREQMLAWGAGTFNAMGPLNDRTRAAFAQLEAMIAFILRDGTPDKLSSPSWGSAIYVACERGELEPRECPSLLLDYIVPSLDTTINATSNAVWLFAKHPEQWDLVRDGSVPVRNAINEALRLESPLRSFTRYVASDCRVGDVTLPAGSRALIMFASANRDERKWDDPEHFDVRRNAADHVAFGFGAHACAGMHLARLELEALFGALARQVRRFELIAAEPSLNNCLRGFKRLDVIAHSA
jgi:cytochrome P450